VPCLHPTVGRGRGVTCISRRIMSDNFYRRLHMQIVRVVGVVGVVGVVRVVRADDNADPYRDR